MNNFGHQYPQRVLLSNLSMLISKKCFYKSTRINKKILFQNAFPLLAIKPLKEEMLSLQGLLNRQILIGLTVKLGLAISDILLFGELPC